MFNASQLVEFVTAMLGNPYWYGTCGYKCTEDLLKRKAKQYPSHYTSGRMAKYREAIAAKKVCMDCIGLIKAFFWTNGGAGIIEYMHGKGDFSSKYEGNGFPDKSANGMLSFCKKNGAKYGKIKDLPDVPGVLLFSEGHVGVYVGGGMAVEARGFAYGVVETKVKDRSWTTWAYIPDALLDYSNAQTEPVPEGLHKGCKGTDVTALQLMLMKLGYQLPVYGADGDFGTETETALKAFQTATGMKADGIATAEVLQALTAAQSHPVTIKTGRWNVRDRDSLDGHVISVVRPGDVVTVTGVVSGTWIQVQWGNGVAWISAKAFE